MNDPDQDEELRGMLREVGRDAERRAPAFQRVWRAAREARATREQQAGSLMVKWVCAAAAILVVAGLIAWMLIPGPRREVAVGPPEEVIQATDAFDQAVPTDFLLTANSDPAMPSIGQLTREIDALLNP